MDAKEYLLKVNQICREYEEKRPGCEGCPLLIYGCGATKDANIDNVIDFVEHYEERTFPFGRCSACKREFNSELISEHEISHCPWCGWEIREE